MKKANPVRIGTSEYYVYLKDGKGRFVGEDFRQAVSFRIFKGRLPITNQILFPSKNAPKRAKLSHIDAKIRLYEGLQYKKQQEQELKRETKERLKLYKELKKKREASRKAKKKAKKKQKAKKGEKKKPKRGLRKTKKEKMSRSEKKLIDKFIAKVEEIEALKKKLKNLEKKPELPKFKKPELKGKDMLTKKLYSPGYQRDITVKIQAFKHKPIKYQLRELDRSFVRLSDFYIAQLMPFYKKLKVSQRKLIFRIVYKARVLGKERELAAGGKRHRVSTEEGFKSFIRESLKNAERKLYSNENSYFSKRFLHPEINLTGFTFEFIDEMGKELSGKALEKRESEWKKNKHKYATASKKSVILTEKCAVRGCKTIIPKGDITCKKHSKNIFV